MRVKAIWNKLFLQERPSIGLSFFRPFAAFTVGAHVLPTLFHLKDNYLSTAFKEKNPSFFTMDFLIWIDKSPDGLVLAMAWLFAVSLLFFFLGLFSQIACIVMTACCYYFYALNSLHIGTLSYDILLVVLFLMCVTGYHGDSLSLDAVRRGDARAFRKVRPYFLQRLLQMQIAFTYFYTAVYKISAGGNWLTGNPLYFLYASSPESVVKNFPGRAFLAAHPQACYWLGIFIICSELLMPFLLFIQRTRLIGILYGFLFHLALVITLHVPTIFLFLFPPQLLLFIEPEKIAGWIEKKREENKTREKDKIIYDGQCGFCAGSIRQLKAMDLFAQLEYVDYHTADLQSIDARLTPGLCHNELQLATTDKKLLGGYFAFRRLTLLLPFLYILAPLLYFPGMSFIGRWAYALIARNRYLFHRSKTCKDNACFR